MPRKHSPADRRRRVQVGAELDRRILRLKRITAAATAREVIAAAVTCYEFELARSERLLELADAEVRSLLGDK